MDVIPTMSSSSFSDYLHSGSNEPIFCATSTPKRKPTLPLLGENRTIILDSFSELTSPNGPPPCKPITPKPQTAITRLELEEINVASPQKRLDMSSSFENTMGSCDKRSPKSFSLRMRRQYSDIRSQRLPISSTWKQILGDSTTAVNLKTTSKNPRVASTSSLRRLGFDRNSPARIAKHRRHRKIAETSDSLKENFNRTDVISFGKYKTDWMLSSLKQNYLHSGRKEPIFCATSTPKRKQTLPMLGENRKMILGSFSELTSPNGPPPCKPITPKPQTAITRLELEEITLASPQKSLDMSSSFENTIGSCGKRPQKSFDLQIKRRYSDIPRERFPLSDSWKESLGESSTAVDLKTASQYSRITSTSSLRHSESSRLGFDRNSPARIAKHRRYRQITEKSGPLKANVKRRDVISFGEYKTDSMVSSWKQNETPLRCVE